jgi:hypothetical protein
LRPIRSNIAANRSQLDTHSQYISFHGMRLDTHDSQLTAHAAGIAANLDRIGVNAAGIASNSGRLDRHFQAIGQNHDDILENSEGVAMAMAMGIGAVPAGARFAVGGRWGNFRSQNALAVNAAARLTDSVSVSAAMGFGVNRGNVGGSAGIVWSR